MLPGRLRTGELLTSWRGPDGLWHARYPSATNTLCGLVAGDDSFIGRRWEPTCGVCSKVARLFDRIDSSMPDHWRIRCVATTLRGGGQCRHFALPGRNVCGIHAARGARVAA